MIISSADEAKCPLKRRSCRGPILNRVGPDETYFEPVLHRAVEISEAKPSGPPDNDQLERLRAAVRQAHDRLTFERMQLQGPPSSAEEARLKQHAVELAATIIRGLNDCLNAGGC